MQFRKVSNIYRRQPGTDNRLPEEYDSPNDTGVLTTHRLVPLNISWQSFRNSLECSQTIQSDTHVRFYQNGKTQIDVLDLSSIRTSNLAATSDIKRLKHFLIISENINFQIRMVKHAILIYILRRPSTELVVLVFFTS